MSGGRITGNFAISRLVLQGQFDKGGRELPSMQQVHVAVVVWMNEILTK